MALAKTLETGFMAKVLRFLRNTEDLAGWIFAVTLVVFFSLALSRPIFSLQLYVATYVILTVIAFIYGVVWLIQPLRHLRLIRRAR